MVRLSAARHRVDCPVGRRLQGNLVHYSRIKIFFLLLKNSRTGLGTSYLLTLLLRGACPIRASDEAISPFSTDPMNSKKVPTMGQADNFNFP